jgi:hypothetical protein
VPIPVTVLLVLAGVALLVFGAFSTGGALRFLSGGSVLLVAVVATAAAVYLFWIGQKANWTSDGPGMLFVMIAIVVCAIVSVLGWMFVFRIAGAVVARPDAPPPAPSGLKRGLRLLGGALLAIAAIGEAIAAYTGRGPTAHSSPVVAVSFDTGRPSLVTLDAGGTLVEWDLHSKRENRRRTVPELAGATEFFMADHGYTIVNGAAVRFAPFGTATVERIPDARHIARSGHVVIARERALILASYSDWTRPSYRELPWPEPILAIAGNDEFIAVADRARVSLLDGRVNSVRTHFSVPAPGTIAGLEVLHDGAVLALDGKGSGWVIDLRRRITEPLAEGASLVASALHVFLVSGRAVSEYDPRRKTANVVTKIRSGARSIDTRGQQVAFGFEGGGVVLGTRTGTGSGVTLETEWLTARPRD